MPDLLMPEDFASLTCPLTVSVKVGEVITTIELTVLSVEPRPSHRFRDAPFSLMLSGPRNPSLPQGTYAVQHPELGVIELFLVPAGQDAQFTQYAVTFN
jgi:hypothetical protein